MNSTASSLNLCNAVLVNPINHTIQAVNLPLGETGTPMYTSVKKLLNETYSEPERELECLGTLTCPDKQTAMAGIGLTGMKTRCIPDMLMSCNGPENNIKPLFGPIMFILFPIRQVTDSDLQFLQTFVQFLSKSPATM